MTATIIIKLISYLAPAGAVAFFFIRHNIKKNQEYKAEIDGKNAMITSLREQIVSLVELQGDIEDVEKQNKDIKKVIADNPDIDTTYSDKLSDMPRRSSRAKNKNT